MEFLELSIPENAESLQLPDPGLLSYYQCMDDRTFWIDYEIDDSLLLISKQILRINAEDQKAGFRPELRKPIKIYLYTNGGSLEAALNFIDVCALSETPVITVNAGRAISAGFLMLLAGHKRYALPHARAMVHRGSGGVAGTFDECESSMNDYKKLIDMTRDYILERTSIPKALYSKNKSKDWYMYLDDQLKYGVIDAVIDNLSVVQ